MKKIKIYSIVGVCAAAVLYMFDIAGNNNNIVNEIGKEWVAESRDMRGTGNLTATNEESATSDESLLKQKSPDGLAEQILVRTGYTVSYNKDTKLPNWVSWYLTPERTTGPAKRAGVDFEADIDVPSPRAEDSDYYGSGYDRGHMCPAADSFFQICVHRTVTSIVATGMKWRWHAAIGPQSTEGCMLFAALFYIKASIRQ